MTENSYLGVELPFIYGTEKHEANNTRTYHPMATIKGSDRPLFITDGVSSIEQAFAQFNIWNQDFHMLEKWIDVYKDGKKVQKINIGLAIDTIENI